MNLIEQIAAAEREQSLIGPDARPVDEIVSWNYRLVQGIDQATVQPRLMCRHMKLTPIQPMFVVGNTDVGWFGWCRRCISHVLAGPQLNECAPPPCNCCGQMSDEWRWRTATISFFRIYFSVCAECEVPPWER